jgi:hypothetical protein
LWRHQLLFGHVRISDGGPMRVTPDGSKDYITAIIRTTSSFCGLIALRAIAQKCLVMVPV